LIAGNRAQGLMQGLGLIGGQFPSGCSVFTSALAVVVRRADHGCRLHRRLPLDRILSNLLSNAIRNTRKGRIGANRPSEKIMFNQQVRQFGAICLRR
jgi:hypothetical protein